jgi:transcription elongation factor GreA
MERKLLTKEGYQKLVDQLSYLKRVRLPSIIEVVSRAREDGDLRENGAYQTAKEEQALVEARIGQLQDILGAAEILDLEHVPKDRVGFGATVHLLDMDTKEQIRYTLLSGDEVDFEEGKISIDSPVGRSLLGRREGEEVEIKVPAGILKYKVNKIVYAF